MATFKIKLEDKAAFEGRLKAQKVALTTNQIKDNDLEHYFEVDIIDPKQLEIVNTILKQSPKINTIKEMEKKKLTASELKEMIRQELTGVLAEKKKKKDEDVLDEGVGEFNDPNFIAGAATLLGIGGTLLITYIKALTNAKTKEDKEKVKKDFANALSKNNRMV